MIKKAIIGNFIDITDNFKEQNPKRAFIALKSCPNENWKFNRKNDYLF